MGNKGPVRYRKYTEEFKVQAIRLAESVGVAAAAKRLGVPDGNLRNWINRGRAGKLESEECAKPVKKSLAEAEAESRRLRRELETTQLDLEIVKRVHRTRYETRAQAKLDIVDWIEGFYNRQPIHSSIGYKTPGRITLATGRNVHFEISTFEPPIRESSDFKLPPSARLLSSRSVSL